MAVEIANLLQGEIVAKLRAIPADGQKTLFEIAREVFGTAGALTTLDYLHVLKGDAGLLISSMNAVGWREVGLNADGLPLYEGPVALQDAGTEGLDGDAPEAESGALHKPQQTRERPDGQRKTTRKT